MEENLKKLISCEYYKNTCFGCVYFFDCNTRSDYVKSVYLDMNPNLDKDDVGFEF